MSTPPQGAARLTQDYLWMRTLTVSEANLTTKLVTAGKRFKTARVDASVMSMSCTRQRRKAAAQPRHESDPSIRASRRTKEMTYACCFLVVSTAGGVHIDARTRQQKSGPRRSIQLVDAASVRPVMSLRTGTGIFLNYSSTTQI
jgi:hypothetical protein